MNPDLQFAFGLADAADDATLPRWNRDGVAFTEKEDGTPVTEADIAAEKGVLDALLQAHAADGFLGEEIGERIGSTGRRWIVDGIDGTRYFAAGKATWGTLIALEVDGAIVLGVSSSPAQNRRWWASLGEGAFTGPTDLSSAARIHVSNQPEIRRGGVVTLPEHEALTPDRQQLIADLTGVRPPNRSWSHQNRVAEGEVDVCVWFAGDIWDHAAPSIIVEEAGGRFTDRWGGKRLDTRTAVYSNGICHDEVLAALRDVAQ